MSTRLYCRFTEASRFCSVPNLSHTFLDRMVKTALASTKQLAGTPFTYTLRTQSNCSFEKWKTQGEKGAHLCYQEPLVHPWWHGSLPQWFRVSLTMFFLWAVPGTYVATEEDIGSRRLELARHLRNSNPPVFLSLGPLSCL